MLQSTLLHLRSMYAGSSGKMKMMSVRMKVTLTQLRGASGRSFSESSFVGVGRFHSFGRRIMHQAKGHTKRGIAAAVASAAVAAAAAEEVAAVAAEAASFDIAQHRRTLRFAISIAAEKVLPGKTLIGGRAIGQGYLYHLENGDEITDEDIAALRATLNDLIEKDTPIQKVEVEWAEAIKYFEAQNLRMSKKLVETRVDAKLPVHICDGKMRLAMTELYDCLGCLKAGHWNIQKSGKGILVTYVSDYVEQPAIMGSLEKKSQWGVHNEITCLGDLNSLQSNNRDRKDLMLASEFMQEAGIVDIVKTICQRPDPTGDLPSEVRVVCIAGPTSSGKTTFATKLTHQLRNKGMPAIPLSVDHYYLPLNRQPRYQARKLRSDVDYDHIESMDVTLVNEHLDALIEGKQIMTPKYNMKTGYRDGDGSPFKIPKGGILVIEGIHALNPAYTSSIPRGKVFKIFLSPITAISVDEANTIKSTDSRLLRRMSRDYLFRGNSASRTLAMWHNVRNGEGTWIFPFQNEADYVMNSAHEYELCVLKPFVEPLLKGVPPTDANFEKAQELLDLLNKTHSWNERDVPSTSLLREFIGHGSFDEH